MADIDSNTSEGWIFASYVTLRLKELHLSHGDLHRKSGVAKTTIARVLNPQNAFTPRQSTVRSLLLALDGTLDAFHEYTEKIGSETPPLEQAKFAEFPNEELQTGEPSTAAPSIEGQALWTDSGLPMVWQEPELAPSQNELESINSKEQREAYYQTHGVTPSSSPLRQREQELLHLHYFQSQFTHPIVLEWHYHGYAEAFVGYAFALKDIGDFRGEELALRRSIAIYRKYETEPSGLYDEKLEVLADCLERQGRFEECEELHQERIRITEAWFAAGLDNGQVLSGEYSAYLRYSKFLLRLGRSKAAEHFVLRLLYVAENEVFGDQYEHLRGSCVQEGVLELAKIYTQLNEPRKLGLHVLKYCSMFGEDWQRMFEFRLERAGLDPKQFV